jgi:hypothetical protein
MSDRIIFVIYKLHQIAEVTIEPGERSRYIDSLEAGRPNDRIPLSDRLFPLPVQTGPEAHLASCKMAAGSLSLG